MRAIVLAIIVRAAACALLSGCASQVAPHGEQVWIPTEEWWAEAVASGGTLTTANGSHRFVQARHARNLREVAAKIREASAIATSLALAGGAELNAFATATGGRRVVTITLALLEAIGDDRDALATTLGHEIAHLHYAHGEARRERDLPPLSVTYGYGMIVGPGGISLGGTTAAFAVNAAFTRYEEREADLKGMEWAVDAGFSPCGSARTMRILARVEDRANTSTLLATHPGHDERIARANALSKRLTGSAC